MRALARRLIRLWGQSRIRLPRCSPGLERIGPGDRLQIGPVVWRVRGCLLLQSGWWMFWLEEAGGVRATRGARLLASAGQRGQSWIFVREGREIRLPAESVTVFSVPHFDKTDSTV